MTWIEAVIASCLMLTMFVLGWLSCRENEKSKKVEN